MTDPHSRRSVLLLVAALGACPAPALPAQGTDVSVMTWNIWHGGREDGKEVSTGFPNR
jgi:hypothetical protein